MNKKIRNKGNGLIPQRLSVNWNVRVGDDLYGDKIPKDWKVSSMRLETWVEDNPEYHIDDGYSDYPTSYIIHKKRPKPIKRETPKVGEIFMVNERFQDEWCKVLSVWCRDDFYIISDGRMSSPYNEGGLSKHEFSFDELIDTITSDDYGVDTFEFMMIKGLNSLGHDGENWVGNRSSDGKELSFTQDEVMEVMRWN